VHTIPTRREIVFHAMAPDIPTNRAPTNMRLGAGHETFLAGPPSRR
jgi:hypothetical protein